MKLVSTLVSRHSFRVEKSFQHHSCLPPVLSPVVALQSYQDLNPKRSFKYPGLLPVVQPALIMLVSTCHQISQLYSSSQVHRRV